MTSECGIVVRQKNPRKKKAPPTSPFCFSNIVESVLIHLTTFLEPEETLYLSQTQKLWHHQTLAANNVKVWKPLADTIYVNNLESDSKPARYKRIVQLISYNGCQSCKKPRIRKVIWQFMCRMCQDCLYKNTISDYSVTAYCDNRSSEILNGLPFTRRTLWNKHVGSYGLKFYWRESINAELRKRNIMTIQEKDDQDLKMFKEREMAFQLEKEEREKALQLEKEVREKKAAAKNEIRKKRKSDILELLSSEAGITNVEFIESYGPLENDLKKALPLSTNKKQKLRKDFISLQDALSRYNERKEYEENEKKRYKELKKVEDEANQKEVLELSQKLNRKCVRIEINQIDQMDKSARIARVHCSQCSLRERNFGMHGLADHTRAVHRTTFLIYHQCNAEKEEKDFVTCNCSR
jgi:hypothetical protein